MKVRILVTNVALACFTPVGVCLAAEYHVAQLHPKAADDNPGTRANPWKTISQAARVLEPGDTVTVHQGVYREHVHIRRGGARDAPITYQAGEGESVVITGADVIDEWVRAEGPWPIWTTPWPHRFETHPNDEQHRVVGRCEQVIVDGNLLKQVLPARGDMPPGTFCADTKNEELSIRLASGDSPTDHVVEASVRRRCFGLEWGEAGVDYIQVKGFIMRYASNMAQRGALYCLGDHWVVQDNVVEWVNGNGISFRGAGNVFRNNVSRYNGQMGMGGEGRDWMLEGNSLVENNQKGYNAGWEAGGIKITRSRNGKISRLQAIGNDGPGIWLDIDVRDVLIDRCLAKDNRGTGIFVEISGDVTITNCLAVANGGGREVDWANGGIGLAESDKCRVEHNVCVGNRTGISIRMQGPRNFADIDGKRVSYYTKQHVIRRNIVANNLVYQFGLWSDNVFFGPHPAESVGSRGTPLDPGELGLSIDENLYFAGRDQGLILWGCPWRPQHKQYDTIAAFTREQKHDAGSIVADPLFADAAAGNFQLRPESPALARGIGWKRVPARQ